MSGYGQQRRRANASKAQLQADPYVEYENAQASGVYEIDQQTTESNGTRRRKSKGISPSKTQKGGYVENIADTYDLNEAPKRKFKSKYDEQIDAMRNGKRPSKISGSQMSSNNGDNSTQLSKLAIENDRLNTKILLMNQKMNDKHDCDEEHETVKLRNFQLEEQLQNSNLTITNNNVTINQLNDKIKLLNSELDKVNQAKEVHKHDNCDMSDKMAVLQEELYEQKQLTLELLEQLKDLEFQLEESQAQQKETQSQLDESQLQLKQSYKQLDDMVFRNDSLSHQVEKLQKYQMIYVAKKYALPASLDGQKVNDFTFRNQQKQMIFLREQDPITEYGHQRVNIKIEKGNEFSIQVDGKFQNIYQFIDTCAPVEMEEIDKDDVILKFHQMAPRKYSPLRKNHTPDAKMTRRYPRFQQSMQSQQQTQFQGI